MMSLRKIALRFETGSINGAVSDMHFEKMTENHQSCHHIGHISTVLHDMMSLRKIALRFESGSINGVVSAYVQLKMVNMPVNLSPNQINYLIGT